MSNKMKAGDLARRRPLLTVNAKTPVSEVMQLMARSKVTAVCVMRRDRLVGVFTMKDVMTRVLGYKTHSIWSVPKRRKIRDVPVRLLMSPRPHVVDAEEGMLNVMEVMRSHRVRHLPVMRDGALEGIITLRDVVDVLSTADNGRKVHKSLASMYFENPYADLAPARVRV